MDNRITKNRVLRHLEYDWFKYLLLIAASAAIWYIVFMEINHSREFEEFTVFFACYENESLIQSDFKNWLSENGDTVIRDVEVTFRSPSDDLYGQLFLGSAFLSDIIICSEREMKSWAPSFLELTDDVLEACLPEEMAEDSPELEFFTYTKDKYDESSYYEQLEGKRYGIRVDMLKKINVENPPFVFDLSKRDTAYTEEQLEEFPTTFYLGINRKSLKIGEYGPKDKYHDLTQAFGFVRFFLETYAGE